VKNYSNVWMLIVVALVIDTTATSIKVIKAE